MKTIFSSLTALLVGFLVTPFLHAETVDWSSTLAFTVNNGIESPTVLFGFNPQPEPPPELVSTGSIDPSTATQELSGVSPQPFSAVYRGRGRQVLVPTGAGPGFQHTQRTVYDG